MKKKGRTVRRIQKYYGFKRKDALIFLKKLRREYRGNPKKIERILTQKNFNTQVKTAQELVRAFEFLDSAIKDSLIPVLQLTSIFISSFSPAIAIRDLPIPVDEENNGQIAQIARR